MFFAFLKFSFCFAKFNYFYVFLKQNQLCALYFHLVLFSFANWKFSGKVEFNWFTCLKKKEKKLIEQKCTHRFILVVNFQMLRLPICRFNFRILLSLCTRDERIKFQFSSEWYRFPIKNQSNIRTANPNRNCWDLFQQKTLSTYWTGDGYFQRQKISRSHNAMIHFQCTRDDYWMDTEFEHGTHKKYRKT